MKDRPEGFVAARSARAAWLARRDCAAAVSNGDADFLFGSAAGAGTERGTIALFTLGAHRAAGKKATHGGLAAPVLRDLYLGRARALAQIAAAERLRAAGVPTPRVLAIGWAQVLGPLHRHAIVTEAIPRARSLLDLLRAGVAPARQRGFVLAAAAAAIRAAHDAGFQHFDLNLANLVLEGAPEEGRVRIVDLDRGRFAPRLDDRARLRALARLLRSYEKWIEGTARLTPRQELAFLRAYCREDRPGARALGAALRRRRARLRLRRAVLRAVGLGA